MCINFNGYHSGGSSFINVNECWLLQKSFVHHRYKLSSEKKNKKKKKKYQYMVSYPEICSDSPIGSNRESGRDKLVSEPRFRRFWKSLCLGDSR